MQLSEERRGHCALDERKSELDRVRSLALPLRTMDQAKELFQAPSKFAKDGSQVRARPAFDASTDPDPVHEPLHQARPEGYVSRPVPSRLGLARVARRGTWEIRRVTYRTRRVSPDLSGGRYRVRHHGRHRLHRQIDPYSHQPNSRRGRIGPRFQALKGAD